MLAVTGSIGIGDSMGQKTSVYSNTIKKEHYTFFNSPQPMDVQALLSSHTRATYSVMQTATAPKDPVPALPKGDPPPPGGGQGGGPAGSASPHQTSGQSDSSEKGGTVKQMFNLQKLTKSAKTAMKKVSPIRFSSFASLFVSLSLLLRPVDASISTPFSSSLGNARRNALETTDESPWEPSSNTSSLFIRKRTKALSVLAFTTALQMLADPDLVTKVASIQDDPNSKDMFHMQLCQSCQERSRRCQECKWLNSHYSLVELEELEAI